MKLHILTLNWNGEDKLKKLAPSLKDAVSKLGMSTQWLIRDNGSSDDSISVVKDLYPDCTIFDVGHNRDSFAAGMNYLLSKSNADDDDLILLLNNDIIFNKKDSIKKMIDLILSDNNIGVVGARLLYPDTDIIQHCGIFFSHKYNCLPFHKNWKKKCKIEDEKIKEYQAVTAALSITKYKFLKKVCTDNKSGNIGFCEKYFWCFEDVDACFAIKYNMGKKIMYHGGAIAYHEESASLKLNPVNKLMLNHNVSVFKERWWGKYKIDD